MISRGGGGREMEGSERTDRSAEPADEGEREGDENLGIHRKRNPRTQKIVPFSRIAIDGGTGEGGSEEDTTRAACGLGNDDTAI